MWMCANAAHNNESEKTSWILNGSKNLNSYAEGYQGEDLKYKSSNLKTGVGGPFVKASSKWCKLEDTGRFLKNNCKDHETSLKKIYIISRYTIRFAIMPIRSK